MISTTYISRNITTLSANYNKSKQPLMTLLYAKLVIIEVGGWVELSMDDLISRAGRKLKEPKNIKHLDATIIRKNYGFEYDQHFRSMLMKAIGLIQIEKLEKRLDVPKHQKMIAALANLKSARNQVAHTYIKLATTSVDAPSLVKSYFQDIHAGLMDIEAKMKILKII